MIGCFLNKKDVIFFAFYIIKVKRYFVKHL